MCAMALKANSILQDLRQFYPAQVENNQSDSLAVFGKYSIQ